MVGKMKIIKVLINQLKPAEYNPRKLTEGQKEEIQKSIKRFGMVEPIVVNKAPERKNVIIGGHQRYYICKEMGWKEMPVVYVDISDIKKERELNLRLNKNLGEWDYDLLANFDEDLLKDIGWDSEDLDRIFNLGAEEDDFDAEAEYEKVKEPRVKIGDLYQLGEHRLLCGDATKKEDVERLMGGEKADMVFTDPPYNVDYESMKGEKIMNDNMKEKEFVRFSEEFINRMEEALKNGGNFYICCGYNSYPIFRYAIKTSGMNFSTMIVWVKNWKSFKSWADYRAKHEDVIKGKKDRKKKAEPIIYGWNKGKHYFSQDKTEADVWEIKCRASNTMVHPTQKPLELIGRAIRNSSKRGEIVLDLFGGSGSTLISAEKEGRRCFIQELDKKYCQVIINRWEKLTNNKAHKIV